MCGNLFMDRNFAKHLKSLIQKFPLQGKSKQPMENQKHMSLSGLNNTKMTGTSFKTNLLFIQ